MKDIQQSQKIILKKFNKYLKKKNNLNNYNYCSLGADTLGALGFKTSINFKKNILRFFTEHLRELYGLGLIKNIKVIKKVSKYNYETVILNWAFKKDFKNFFYDKYFNLKTIDKKKILWILIYLSNKLPKKLPINSFVIQIERNKKFNFIHFFSNIFFILKSLKYSLFSLMLNFSQQKLLSLKIPNLILKNLNFFETKKFLITYESQLFQKKLISRIKQKFKKLKIIGYDHTAPQPLPINLYYDKFSPDLLVVSSKNKFLFNNLYLDWPKKKMKVMKSFRFRINKSEFQSKIFLPYIIKNEEIYVKNLIKLMRILNIKNLNSIQIKIHPACLNKRKHQSFANKLHKLENKNFKAKNINDEGKKFVIFLGQTTAIPLAIESGLKCFNICVEPEFDVYNPKIWKGINCKLLNKYTYLYTLKKKNSLIWIDNKFNKFNKIISD